MKKKNLVFILRFLFLNLVIWGIIGSIVGMTIYAPAVLFWMVLVGIVAFGSLNFSFLWQEHDKVFRPLSAICREVSDE